MPSKKLLPAARGRRSRTRKPELPRYEARRGPGSTAEVDFWTSREPREIVRSHVNFSVPDTKKWEQSAAYLIDPHPATQAFVKNAGRSDRYLILETKGFDELEEVKREAATRWAHAVNAEGSFGAWFYDVAKKVSDVPGLIAKYATA